MQAQTHRIILSRSLHTTRTRFIFIRQDLRQLLPEREKTRFFSTLWQCANRRPIPAFPRKFFIALKYNSLYLKFPSEARLSQNPSSKRMQLFSNSGPFPSALGAAWRFSAKNAASMRPTIRDATVIVSDAAIRSCDWPAGRAAGAPCSPCRNAPAPRRSRSGRTARRTSGPCPGVARAPDRGPPPGSP